MSAAGSKGVKVVQRKFMSLGTALAVLMATVTLWREQWLTPLPGGKAARSKVTIRKFGMTVGKSEGMVKKL